LKKLLASLIIVLLASLSTILLVNNHLQGEFIEEEPCYVGVAFCGNTTIQAKNLIDRVKNYTNLFILQSGPISENETATTQIIDYAVDAGLNSIVYFGDLDPKILENKSLVWRQSWVENAKDRYGEKFFGVYLYDEPGGIWLDHNWTKKDFEIPIYSIFDDISHDSNAYVFEHLLMWDEAYQVAKSNSNQVFVSDYGLYWFDYLAGYDVVFAQIGWNHTLKQDIALVRGAARMQNKNWGTMITWKYDTAPYLDTGEAIFEQMRTSYECGAQYITIFNYPNIEGNNLGAMTPEHFEALERFWIQVVQNPDIPHGSTNAQAALVLPKNYGWGMRHPQDRIWGWFGPDEKSPQIWELSRHLLSEYGYTLDIIFEDPAFPINTQYKDIYYWNQTIDIK